MDSDLSRANASSPAGKSLLGNVKAQADPSSWQDPYTMPVPSFTSFPDLAIPSFQAPPIASSAGLPMTTTTDHATNDIGAGNYDSEEQQKDTFDLIPSSPDIEGASLRPSRSDKKKKKQSKESKKSRHDKEDRGKARTDPTVLETSHRDERTDRHVSRRRERRTSQDRDRDRDRDRSDRDRDRNRQYEAGNSRRSKSRSRSRERERDRDRWYRESRQERNRSRERERYTTSSAISSRHDHSGHRRSSRRGSASPERRHQSSSSRDKPLKDQDRSQRNDQWSRRREHDNANRVPAAFSDNKEDAWVMDVKGDFGNLKYGHIDHNAVPRYNRAGGGRILGTPNDRIDFEKTREVGRGIVTRQVSGFHKKAVRYTHPAAQLLEEGDEHKISQVKITALANKLTEQDARGDGSYISLDLKKGASSGRRRDAGGYDNEDGDENLSDADDQVIKLPDYRDIHGYTKPTSSHQFDDDIMEQGNTEDAVSESKMDRLIRERLELDNELRRNPKQPDKWLAFIAVNNNIDLLSTKRSHAARLKGSAHSLAHLDIVLSMFERALQANPTNSGLLLNYLNCARLVWEPAKLLDKWDEILTSEAVQTEWPAAWIEYLNFRQRHFHSFTVSTLVRVVSDGLASLGRRARLLAQNIAKSIKSSNPSDSSKDQTQKPTVEKIIKDRRLLIKIENVIVHLQARAWTFLREAGYSERAYGIIQAEMEFLFHAPNGLEQEPLPIQMASLEEYWDSELPRFSEGGAKGWAHYVTQEEEVEMNDDLLNSIQLTTIQNTPQDDAEMIEAIAKKDEDRQRYRLWAQREQEWDRKYWFPIRTTDGIPTFMEEDPYGIILFEDIEPFIVSLYSVEARRLYVDCVIHFAGLPAIANSGGSNGTPSGTFPHPFVHDGLLQSISSLRLDGSRLTGVDAGDMLDMSRYLPPHRNAQLEIEQVLRELEMMQQGIEPPDRDWNSIVWRHPLSVFPMAADNLLTSTALASKSSSRESESQSPALAWASVLQQGDAQRANKVFLEQSLEQLSNLQDLSRGEQRSYELLMLIFESASTKSSSKGQKMAKKLLKRDRMDLELWNAYAQMEKAFGRVAEARKVYITALSMYKSFPAEHQDRAPLLHRSFAELEWEQGRYNVALTILVAMVLPSENSPLDTLERTMTAGDLDTPPSPTLLAKARQIFKQKVAQLPFIRPDPLRTIHDENNDSNGARWFDPSLDLIVCFALFEYLASGQQEQQQVHAALRVFEQVLQQLDWRYPDSLVPMLTPSVENPSFPVSTRRRPAAASTLFHEDVGSAEKAGGNCAAEAEMVWTQMVKFVYWHDLQATTTQHRGSHSNDHSASSGGGGGYKLGELRRLVELGLARFPNNSILQSMYFWTEAKQRISGRVKAWILDHAEDTSRGGQSTIDRHQKDKDEKATDVGGVSPAMSNIWIFGIFYELWHQERYNIHSVRTMFDAALGQSTHSGNSATSKSSMSSVNQGLLFPAMYSRTSTPLLWRLYIELELREAQTEYERQMQLFHQAVNVQARHRHKRRRRDDEGERGDGNSKTIQAPQPPKPPSMSTRPKDLLLRALQDCPWCKDLYLVAFLHPQMRSLFSAAEMEQLYRTMLEKELRVHQDLPFEESSQ